MLSRAELVENHLLSLLPDGEVEALLPHVERVNLQVRHLAYDVNQPIEHAYFPTDGVISILGVMSDKTAVEVATIGNEGVVGLPLFLGARMAIGQAFVQVAGTGLRIRADHFVTASRRGRFREVLELYTQALFTQVAQAAACNRLHLTEERFARWLLMTQDRVSGDQFTLTQDFLSQMLGVRRATVSEIAAEAQRNGMIEYSRGRLTIVNRQALLGLSCECYGLIRSEYERLLGQAHRRPNDPPAIPELSRAGKSLVTDGTPRDHHHSEVIRANGSSS